ncbi:transposase [Clostridium sp. DL1XJH146]
MLRKCLYFKESSKFYWPSTKKYLKEYPSVTRCIRRDSGFAVSGLYELAEQLETLYSIRLKANATLYKLTSKFENKLIEKYKGNPYDYQVIYEEFQYKASSWEKNRRVEVKIEKPEWQIGYHYTFVVTNMTVSPKNIINFYCNRGTMENFTKGGKNGFAFCKMSSRKYLANANKLQEMVLAYNLNNLFRRLCFSKNIKENRIETIRMKIIKVAAKVIKTGRYLKFKLCSSYAYKKEFWHIIDKINELPYFT